MFLLIKSNFVTNHKQYNIHVIYLVFFFILIAVSQSYAEYKVNTEKPDPPSLLPIPQNISLIMDKFEIDESWYIQLGANISENTPAVQSLREGLKRRFGLYLNNDSENDNSPIKLVVQPRSVPIGNTVDTKRKELKKQAYNINLNPKRIIIKANNLQGLYYGVQSFLQFANGSEGTLTLQQGEITDWPDLELRMLYWDDNHHLEYLEVLKNAIRKASFYKINAFALKLNGHFQFNSAKPVVEPNALTPQQYQELTDFAEKHYVQLIPYLDAPGHDHFILKHLEYSDLRAFPNSNYEFCVTNPKTYELLGSMFNDLINANKGGRYILLSTDEPYYLGLADNQQCHEKEVAEKLGGKSALYAKFLKKLGNKINKPGREVIFWGGGTLKAKDVKRLPKYFINGLPYSNYNYESEDSNLWKAQGIRQMIETSTQGVEPLFPHYYSLNNDKLVHSDKTISNGLEQFEWSIGRVENMYETIDGAIQKGKADLMGTIIAGWGDTGLHPETFWLGYITGNAIGWNYKDSEPKDLMNRFYNVYYGKSAYKMDKVYRMMSTQAQFYGDSWDWEKSDNRKPIFGNSEGIFKPPHPAKDQTILMLPIPSAQDLSIRKNWSKKNERRLKLAHYFLGENNETLKLLRKNLDIVNKNRYSIQLMTSIAYLCRQNINMLLDLGKVNDLLKEAANIAASNPSLALELVDQAVGQVGYIKRERNIVLDYATNTWYQTWQPRVKEANGRQFLHELDDVKDHLPDRTVDMSYLIYRELEYPLGKWVEQVQENRNQFARKNHLPQKSVEVQWTDYK